MFSDSDGDIEHQSPPSVKKAKRKKKGLVPDSGMYLTAIDLLFVSFTLHKVLNKVLIL